MHDAGHCSDLKTAQKKGTSANHHKDNHFLWVCDALRHPLCTVVGLVLKRKQGHKHDPGRNVALALAVAGLPSALVGRWGAPVSEPHCVRGNEKLI